MLHISAKKTFLTATIDPRLHHLFELYRDHNGMPLHPGDDPIPLRFMSIEEADNLNNNVRNLKWINDEQYLFWTDDKSNYAGVYLAQPLTGCVFFVDHEEADYSPRFRSIYSFITALADIADRNSDNHATKQLQWWDLKTDFPKRQPEPEYDKEEHHIAKQYIQQFHLTHDHAARTRFAYFAMNLLPFDVREPLVMFADYERDFYVQERALEIFGLRKDNAAVPQIEPIIRKSRTYSRIAGLIALGNIATPDAINALIRVSQDVEDLHPNSTTYIAGALQKAGIETKRERGIHSYRLNPNDAWVTIGQKR
ncbi:MAG: HEAT repeat domain-containing protein [Chloroflexota bacterium]|nr:HEAT repeat domain-containing protein [Chloroflexota bacterium]